MALDSVDSAVIVVNVMDAGQHYSAVSRVNMRDVLTPAGRTAVIAAAAADTAREALGQGTRRTEEQGDTHE